MLGGSWAGEWRSTEESTRGHEKCKIHLSSEFQ